MKVFLYKTVFYSLIGLILFVIIRITMFYLHQSKADTKNFNSAFVDKLQILKTYKDQKKIILLGGSSVAFGLSAEQIEQSTRIKTINLGHHAGFGLVDFRDFVIKNLTPEDIIIFSPEWHFYTLPENVDEATLSNLINNNIEYGKLLGDKDHIIRAMLFYPVNHPPQYAPYVYDCINANGDITTHCNLPSVMPLSYEVPDKKFDFDYFEKIFPFVKKTNTLILFPPTQTKVFEKSKSKLDEIEKELRTHHVNIANAAKNNVYQESSFFDATYHLDCATRKIRTDSLIQNINRLYPDLSKSSLIK